MVFFLFVFKWIFKHSSRSSHYIELLLLHYMLFRAQRHCFWIYDLSVSILQSPSTKLKHKIITATIIKDFSMTANESSLLFW